MDATPLDQETIEYLRQDGGEMVFPADEVIIRRGDPGDAVFIILEGQVEVRLRAADGRHLSLATLGPGEMFGELSVLRNAPASADVRTIGKALGQPEGLMRFVRGRGLQLTRVAVLSTFQLSATGAETSVSLLTLAQVGVIVFAAGLATVAIWRVVVRSRNEGHEIAPMARLTLPVLFPAYIAIALLIVM